MTAPEQRRVKLPASVLASAKAIASDATMAPSARLAGVMMLIWGWFWYEQQTEIDGRNFAIPREQWLEVCVYLTSGVPGDRIDCVNLGMAFMNQGPSSYAD